MKTRIYATPAVKGLFLVQVFVSIFNHLGVLTFLGCGLHPRKDRRGHYIM